MKTKVLVIDKDKESYRLFKVGASIFFSDEENFVEVQHCHTCVDALNQKNISEYDVILVDYNYDDEMIHKIIQLTKENTKVQVMSHIRDMSFIKNVIKMGAIGVLYKPFSFEDVLKNAYTSLFKHNNSLMLHEA